MTQWSQVINFFVQCSTGRQPYKTITLVFFFSMNYLLSSSNAFASRARDLEFKSRASQNEHRVANASDNLHQKSVKSGRGENKTYSLRRLH